MEIILYKPEIAGNVGAIIRLAANTGIPVNIVESKTLEFDETKVKRSGLDYHDIASVTIRIYTSSASAGTRPLNWRRFK